MSRSSNHGVSELQPIPFIQIVWLPSFLAFWAEASTKTMLPSIVLLDSSSVSGEEATAELSTASLFRLAPWTPRGFRSVFFLFLTATCAQYSLFVAVSFKYLAISSPATNLGSA